MHLKQFSFCLCFLSVFNVIHIITSQNNQKLSIDQKRGSLTPNGSPQLIPCNQAQPSFGAQLSSITVHNDDSTSTKSPMITHDTFSKTLKRLPPQNDSMPTDSAQRPPTRRPTEHSSTTKPA